MDPAIALVAGRVVAGFHSALIVFFFFGWFFPYASLRKRIPIHIGIGLVFLFFWVFGSCPLTVWEGSLRMMGGEYPSHSHTFVHGQLARFGIFISEPVLSALSFILILLTTCSIASYYYLIAYRSRNY